MNSTRCWACNVSSSSNDRSTDDFLDVLRPDISAGEVQLLQSPCPEVWQGEGWVKYQCAVLGSLCKQLRGVSRWLARIDLDEFIVPREADNLIEFLVDYEDYGGVYIRWEPFGTSCVARLAEDDLLTEKLNMKWKFVSGHDMLGKSIVKPHRVASQEVHRCELVPGYRYVDFNPGMTEESPICKAMTVACTSRT